MSWWERRIASLDFETTAADPEEARIVTAALLLVGGGTPPHAATWLADPGVEIPEGAAEVHGVTTERARAEGSPAGEVVEEVMAYLRAAVCGAPPLGRGMPLVIYNARYDLTVLAREAERYGVEPLGPVLVVDPLVIDRHLDRYRRGSRALGPTCEHYGVMLSAAHDAEADALAAARLAWCLGARGEIVRRVFNAETGREKAALVAEWEAVRGDLPRLHNVQVRWAAEQARGLAAHFRKEGRTEDADGVREDWPVVLEAPRA